MVEHASLRLLLERYEQIQDMDVRIYRSSSPLTENSSARHRNFSLYHWHHSLRSKTRRLVAKHDVSADSPSDPRWLEFDLTDEVASWIESDPLQRLCLGVDIRRKNGRRAKVDVSTSAINVHALYAAQHLRSKRHTRDQLISLHRGRRTECRGDGKKCCRHRMTVIFKDLEGFDFIIQPKSFDAGFCKGRCPPRYNPAHHHALLQSLIWKEDRKRVPRPCCAPSKLAELEILYFDENDATKLKVSNWKDMRVLECACS